MQLFNNDWQEVLNSETEKGYFADLMGFVEEEYEAQTSYPPKDDIFNAFNHTPFEQVKVVILGQDPYHGAGQAHGLSFSVKPGVKHPPSLRNMLKELKDDLGCEIPKDGTLTKWADQGVLMLNTVLTVREGEAHSHKGMGWETFTDTVIRKLSEREKPIVFVLWGKPAQKKKMLIDTERHAVIESVHPSPLSARRGFFGSRPYSAINEKLREFGQEPIDFCL
ncbi:uracil-DNA glycosylase [Chungangia koreensis]|uniref:Uracil-DNA glycosylase n=1 Tax=Chungangia koreensis TaxID=752657 RepID=A0ABV8X6V7_9LACT